MLPLNFHADHKLSAAAFENYAAWRRSQFGGRLKSLMTKHLTLSDVIGDHQI
jgi:hypothetical protein